MQLTLHYLQPIAPTQVHAFYGADIPSTTNDEYANNMRAQAEHRAGLQAAANALNS